MAKNRKHNLPGTIYKNKNRWWWKVKLPGEDKSKARPLKPVGSSMATKDYNVAVECAKMMLSQTVFKTQQKSNGLASTIAELAWSAP